MFILSITILTNFEYFQSIEITTLKSSLSLSFYIYIYILNMFVNTHYLDIFSSQLKYWIGHENTSMYKIWRWENIFLYTYTEYMYVGVEEWFIMGIDHI